MVAAAIGGCAKPAPVDFTKATGFSDPSACIFMPQGEHAFDDMLHGIDEDGGMRSDPFIDLYEREYPVRASSQIDKQNEAYSYRATVTFPSGSRWHGLKLAAIARDEAFVLGKDGMRGRSFTLHEPIDKVRALVRSMSIPLDKEDHAFLDIIDGRSCDGSLKIRPVEGGSEMRCEWGC